MLDTDQDITNLMRSNSGARWGNKFGMILLPVSYIGSNCPDPLEYVRRAKVMIDRKKQSLEAHFSYKVGDFVMSTLGAKVRFIPLPTNLDHVQIIILILNNTYLFL